MKNTLRFLKCAGFDAALAYLIYAWKFEGADGYGNVVMFWFWFVSIIGILAMFIPVTGKQKPRVKWIDAFNNATSFFFVFTLAYFSHFVLASFLAIGAIGGIIYRDKFDDEGLPKPKEAA